MTKCQLQTSPYLRSAAHLVILRAGNVVYKKAAYRKARTEPKNLAAQPFLIPNEKALPTSAPLINQCFLKPRLPANIILAEGMGFEPMNLLQG